MDASETARLIDQLRTLKEDCESLAETATMAGERKDYPPDIVQLLSEASKGRA